MMKLYRILSEKEALEVAEAAKGLEWAEGKARTPELTGTVKQNREVLSHKLLPAIGKKIVNHPSIQMDHIPRKAYSPKFSRYSDGEHYKAHTDAPWMGETRTDLSCTLWLNDDYEGGELEVEGNKIRGKPGECLVYDCGSIHEVKPVTSGERICVVTWMQSRIRDKEKRRLVSDYRKFLAKFEGGPLFVEGGRIHSALLRRWSE
jgi:PKHD-type hydroxylase